MTADHVDGGVAVAVLATLTTMLMIGLGFLYRPTTATLLWSLTFIVVMLSSFGLLIAETVEIPWLDELSAGIVLGAPAFVWSGLRAARGAQPHAWAGPAVSVSAGLALAVASGAAWYPIAYAMAYVTGSAWAALSVYELLRRPERGGGRLVPLTLISGLLPILGFAGIFAAILEVGYGINAHAVPDLKSIGIIAYLTCAIVTLLSLARRPGVASVAEGAEWFPLAAADRLSRAEAAGDESWSLLAVSLDDTDALHSAGGEDSFRRIVERLHSEVRAAFPVGADIGADGASGFLVLVPGPDAVVRDCVRRLLARVSTVSGDQPLSVEFSASVGWAAVRSSGYDIDALTAAARTAMELARAEGGHRWSRLED